MDSLMETLGKTIIAIELCDGQSFEFPQNTIISHKLDPMAEDGTATFTMELQGDRGDLEGLFSRGKVWPKAIVESSLDYQIGKDR